MGRNTVFCLLGLLGLFGSQATAAAGALTEIENRWVKAGWSAVAYAKAQGLPVDIVVQPDAQPGHTPLAMGYVAGRCKLVLTMRDNPAVERLFGDAPAELHDTLISAMTAHELGHCWRYAHGTWHRLPAGFAGSPFMSRPADAAAAAPTVDEREQRFEEGYADLVGLAWTRRQHPQRYAEVHAWLDAERERGREPGSAHDTAVWVRLARDPSVFGAAGSLFEQAERPWQHGLASVQMAAAAAAPAAR